MVGLVGPMTRTLFEKTDIIPVMLGLSLSDIWLLDKGRVQFPIIVKYFCYFFSIETIIWIKKSLRYYFFSILLFKDYKLIVFVILTQRQSKIYTNMGSSHFSIFKSCKLKPLDYLKKKDNKSSNYFLKCKYFNLKCIEYTFL